jgi:hypothetical protein
MHSTFMKFDRPLHHYVDLHIVVILFLVVIIALLGRFPTGWMLLTMAIFPQGCILVRSASKPDVLVNEVFVLLVMVLYLGIQHFLKG